MEKKERTNLSWGSMERGELKSGGKVKCSGIQKRPSLSPPKRGREIVLKAC